MFFFSNTKSYLHNQSDQQVTIAPNRTKGFKISQMPKANSKIYEEYYKVEEDQIQYLCNPKSHGQNDI